MFVTLKQVAQILYLFVQALADAPIHLAMNHLVKEDRFLITFLYSLLVIHSRYYQQHWGQQVLHLSWESLHQLPPLGLQCPGGGSSEALHW